MCYLDNYIIHLICSTVSLAPNIWGLTVICSCSTTGVPRFHHLYQSQSGFPLSTTYTTLLLAVDNGVTY